MAWKADDSTMGKYNINSKMFPDIILTFLNTMERLGVLTGGHGGLPYEYHPDALERVNQSKYGRSEYRVAINSLFSGAKGTTPGFPNALMGGQPAEQWCSPYRGFESIPSAVEGEYTSEHAARGRTPEYDGAGFDAEHQRAAYVCAMAHGKTRDDAITSICTFEVMIGSQSRVLCVKAKKSRGDKAKKSEGNQSNELGDMLTVDLRYKPIIGQVQAHNQVVDQKAKKLVETRRRSWPLCALTKLLPYYVLGQQDEVKIYRNEPSNAPPRITLFQFISETDGAARREYRNQFSGEYPWLTDAHIKDILDFYCEYFPSVMTLDKRSELEALLS